MPAVTRVLRLLLIACAVPACTPRPAPTTDATVTEEQPGLFALVAIPPDSAVAIAKARVPGIITKGELERENGTLLYSFDISVAGAAGVTEVHIDAQSGTVLSVAQE